MSSPTARLLGFAPLAGLDALRAALNAVAGTQVHACHGPGLVALLQQEPDAPLFGGGRKALAAGLLTVQRRQELACRAGPFLPMDPAAACCPAASVSHLLEPAWDALGAALAVQGGRHQWDVALRWAAEPVVARHRAALAATESKTVSGKTALAEAVGGVLLAERSRREAALLAALAPAALAFASGRAACTETEAAVTLLANADAEAAVEAALDALPAAHAGDAIIDKRGPLPPLSFSAVRLVTVEARDITRAWQLLGLPERVDLASLHRHWRQCAASGRPDQRPAKDAVMVTDAYRLLRPLLLVDGAATFQTVDSLLRHAGPRLIVPDDPVVAPTGVQDPMRALAS